MGKIKVSVVIPVYNTEKYVSDALGSILDQALKDIEIIVVNDGSTDKSLEIIESMARLDKRIRIHNQDNKGLSESRNYGIRVARGEFIYFMDSDDILDPNALSDCYAKCNHNELDFVFFDAKPFGQTSVINYERTHLFDEKIYTGPEILDGLLSNDVFLSSACLNFINLTFLKSIGLLFHPNILHEDELFTFLLFLQSKRVGFISYPYFKRRIRHNSIMTSQFSRKNVSGYFVVARELIGFKGKEKTKFNRSLIDRRLTKMLRGVLYKTRSMKLSDRGYVLLQCLSSFRKYTSVKDLGMALFAISKVLK